MIKNKYGLIDCLIGGTVIVKLTTALIARGQQIYNGNAWKHLCYNWQPRNALLLQCSMQKQLAICLIYHGVSSGIRTFEITYVADCGHFVGSSLYLTIS